MYVMCNPDIKNGNKIINVSMTEEELRKMFEDKKEFNKYLECVEQATGIMLPRL